MNEVIASTYKIIQKIGSGGGGTVYLAEHLRLGKNVVLKADKRKLTAKPELLRREVDVLKELKHTYIPRVYDFFVEDETVYTVMDYIEGESLDKALKRGERFSQPQVIRWGIQLLDALDYLHRPVHGTPPKGYVHSDIKPANLMRTPDNNICLIDFNIALSLGETHVIGASAGYASPEHYGRDFSFSGSGIQETATAEYEEGEDKRAGQEEGKQDREMKTSSMSALNVSSFGRKTIIPDVRSDIYSVGATLYHLLSGRRPAKEAVDVVPLSGKEYSPLLAGIITKAMNPNPDLRYQTAEEMREAFLHLRENDPRTKSWKRKRKMAFLMFPLLISISAVLTFIGLKRLQITDNWLKLTEYAKNAMEQGDMETARKNIRQALPDRRTILTPELRTETQRALTNILGVYDVSNGYRAQGVIELPSEALGVEIAPDGRTGVGLCSGNIVVFDIENEKILTELPAEPSALSEVKYLDEHTILYAGEGGIRCFDIAKNKEIWAGEPATKICVSSDGRTAAAVYKDETNACLYNTEDGSLLQKLDFGGKHQSVTENDGFANPQYNLLALSPAGRFLAVSFDDGTLTLYDLQNGSKPYYILKDSSDYYRFGGGFSGQYLAFTATSPSESVFVVVDTEKMEQTGGSARTDNSIIEVYADDTGIYIKSDNILAAVDPVTGNQTPLVKTAETILEFDTTGTNTVITTDSAVQFYDHTASLVSEFKKENTKSFPALAENAALIGSLDSPVIRIMNYEKHPEADVFAYDPSYRHDEIRISADRKNLMLFSYDGFRLYDMQGKLLKEVQIPDAEQVYDQQFVRDKEGSRLEVIYNDGKRTAYSAKDGELLYEEEGDSPDLSFEEEFVTDKFRIRSTLHGQPEVYDMKTGKLVCRLEEDAYLTYVTQVNDGIIVQYVEANGDCYGQLLNEKWEVLADLPYLCDVVDGMLLFDYPDGNVRQTHIYRIDQLREILKGEENNA